MAFSVKLTQKTQTGGVNPVVATRTLLDDISSTASTVAFEKEVSMTGNVTIGDASSDSLLLLGGRIQSLSPLQWTCKDDALSSLKIGSSAIPNLINIDTDSTPNKVTIRNLEVIDNFTEIKTINLTIKDPLIKLGNGNETDGLDLGFYCQYKRSTETIKYAGLFRDADDDGKFKLFKDLTSEPYDTDDNININIDTNGNVSGYTAATLVVGSLEAATTPIGVSSGGTGQTTYENGELLIGNTNGNTLSKRTITGNDGITITNGNGSIEIDLDLKSNGGAVIENNKLAINLDDSAITGTLAVGDGGTSATNASDARTNLGLEIGTDVQAYDADLSAIAGLTSAADKGIQFTGSGTADTFDLTSAGKALLDDADAATQRTTLGVDTYVLTTMLDDISTASSCFVVAPKDGTIKKIYSVINDTIAGNNAEITINVNGGTNITNKLIIDQSNSEEGVVDSVTPGNNNTVYSGQYIKLTTNGGSTGTVRAIFTIEITLT